MDLGLHRLAARANSGQMLTFGSEHDRHPLHDRF
jgi:hypothetical protein